MNQHVRCLIVDDEPLAIDLIKGYIEQIPQLELVDICHDAIHAFQVISRERIDLIFLDIEMPDMNGIEFVKSLKVSPKVILITAYREYALESYDIEVVDYLLKPVSFSRFFKAFTKYLSLTAKVEQDIDSNKAEKSQGSIYVYSEKKNVKVYFDDILFIESIKDYVRIHTSEKNIISKDTITRYEGLLPDSFMRVHRSYIVNTSKISAFTHNDIEIGLKEIPIGASYKRKVIDILKR